VRSRDRISDDVMTSKPMRNLQSEKFIITQNAYTRVKNNLGFFQDRLAGVPFYNVNDNILPVETEFKRAPTRVPRYRTC
jgi:hypothetical protein